VLFFYFDYTDQINQTLETFAASLMKQLLCAGQFLPKEVEAAYDDCKNRYCTLDFATLSHLFDSCSQRFSSIHLVLDALDEYHHTKIKKLVSFLCHLKDETECRFKILCTTRAHLRDIAVELKAGDIFDIEACNPDVGNYVKCRMEEWEHDEDLIPEVIDAITRQKDIK
jgi:hypothetical protein